MRPRVTAVSPCLLAVGLALATAGDGRPPRPAAAGARQGGEHDEPDAALRQRLRTLRDEHGLIPRDGLLKARDHLERMRLEAARLGLDAAGIEPGHWSWLGPGNVGGRVRALAIHPSQPERLWAGSVGGGIWRTTNGGQSWSPVDDFMANLAVTSLVLQPGNPNVMYAATGEGFFNGDAIRGAGIFKSTDAGVTWLHLPATAAPAFDYVNRLALSPSGDVLLAATRAGLQRSADGGVSWQAVAAGDALDVDFHPTDGSRAVAGGYDGFVVYSTNGGLNWAAATAPPGADRVEVAYARSQPDVVYASADRARGELWKSVDGGHTFGVANSGQGYLASQGWYDDALWVDPTNPDVVLVGGIDLWRSLDGGASLDAISAWYLAPLSAHADQHVIVAHPGYNGTSNRTVFFGNDGGVYRADDVYQAESDSGWQELNNNLGITQFYGAAGSMATGTILGGTQDNGTLRYTPGGGTEGWTETYGADGGFVASDSTDPHYFYGETQTLGVFHSLDGGVSAQPIDFGLDDAFDCTNFIAPLVLDPNDPTALLAGGCRVWRTVNARASVPGWRAIKPATAESEPTSAIAVAEGNSDLIWVAQESEVYRTTNGTAGVPFWSRRGQGRLPSRYVTRLTIDRSNHDVVYVCFGGFAADNLWRTTDGGVTWNPITGAGATALPAVPVRSLVIHPQRPSWLYAGTEAGAFTSEDAGQTWVLPQDGPANVSVDELFWMGSNLVAVTHGRGLFRVPVALAGQAVTLAFEAAVGGVPETSPSVSLRVHLSTADGQPLAGPASVDYATADATARAGQDYVPASGTLSFPPGTPNGATATVTVALLNDAAVEANETFSLVLSGPSGGLLAPPTRPTVTLWDDDTTPSLAIRDNVVREGPGDSPAAAFDLALNTISGRSIRVDFVTHPGSAAPGRDYEPRSGTVLIPPGTAILTIPVAILGDALHETEEFFTVELTSVEGATVTDTVARGTILDDDPYPVGDGDGLLGTYFDEIDFSGPRVTRVDPVVDFAFGTGPPHPAIGPDSFSVVWVGRVQPRFDELHTFFVESDEGVRLWLNGDVLIDRLVDQTRAEWQANAFLLAGVKYDIRLQYYDRAGDASVRLRWSSASTPKGVIPQTQLYSSHIFVDDVTVTEGDTGTSPATFTLQLSAPRTEPVSVRFATAHGSAGRRQLTATGPVFIAPAGPATPYPSVVTLGGLTGTVSRVRVTLSGYSHDSGDDVDMMLVGPGGEAVVLTSDVGGFAPGRTGRDLTFDSAAVDLLPRDRFPSGTYRPFNNDPGDIFPPPAPLGLPDDDLDVFRGTDPNGEWSLYVVDDLGFFSGTVASWILDVQTEGEDYVGVTGLATFAPGQTSLTVDVPVAGDAEPEADETFSLNLYMAMGAVIGDAQGVATILDDDGGLVNRYYPVTPCRLADTRLPIGPTGGPALSAGGTRVLQAAGLCGVPPEAKAVALNLTAVGATQAGNLRAFAADGAVPPTSIINFTAGRARANNAIVPLGSAGFLAVRPDMGAPGTVQLVLDVYGYFR